MYSLDIWAVDDSRDALIEILKNYPGSYLGNQYEDFDGQCLYVAAKGIVFETEEDMLLFVIGHGADYGAKVVNKSMRRDIEHF